MHIKTSRRHKQIIYLENYAAQHGFENTHEAIVDEETWKFAQQVKRTYRRTDTTGAPNPFTGLVFCADCGKKMYNHRGIKKTEKR